MPFVTSADGTRIVFDRQGSGPVVVLVTGALDDGSENAPLATELAPQLTVLNYARRGRGSSGDTQPYAVDREIEDIDALIAAAAGSAHVYGVSSGGALALRAAAAGLPITRLAVYEVPYFTEEDELQRWAAYVEELGRVIAEGRSGVPLELFHRLTGFSDDDIVASRASPQWAAAEALERTLAYDAAVLGDGEPPIDQLGTITQPTLVVTGGQAGFIEPAADAIAASVPDGHRLTLDGQSHVVDPTAMAPVLGRFFLGE
jgi:pimeloyl-ACP methyl ester carboxylesterase